MGAKWPYSMFRVLDSSPLVHFATTQQLKTHSTEFYSCAFFFFFWENSSGERVLSERLPGIPSDRCHVWLVKINVEMFHWVADCTLCIESFTGFLFEEETCFYILRARRNKKNLGGLKQKHFHFFSGQQLASYLFIDKCVFSHLLIAIKRPSEVFWLFPSNI